MDGHVKLARTDWGALGNCAFLIRSLTKIFAKNLN